MADSSDCSSIGGDSGSSTSSNASIKEVEAPDGNVSKPKKKQKILFDFFKIKRKRGRPKKAKAAQGEKAKPKRGRPPSQLTVDPLLPASNSNPSLPISHQVEDRAPLKAKKPRINWAVGIEC
jgi:hypothetical protein